MDDYTPTTEEVRDRYWINDGGFSDPEDAKRFDRWLASVRADAWDEGEEAGESNALAWDGWRYRSDYVVASNPYRSEKQ